MALFVIKTKSCFITENGKIKTFETIGEAEDFLQKCTNTLILSERPEIVPVESITNDGVHTVVTRKVTIE